MKKYLSILAVAALLFSCSKDDEAKIGFTEQEQQVLNAIQGTFYGEYYTNNGSTLYMTEEISFSPYSEPKSITGLWSFTAAGIGTITTTYGNGSSILGKEYIYFSLSTSPSGEEQTISFYKYDPDSGYLTNKEDKRIITIINNSSFKMRAYGLTKENDVTFKKR